MGAALLMVVLWLLFEGSDSIGGSSVALVVAAIAVAASGDDGGQWAHADSYIFCSRMPWVY